MASLLLHVHKPWFDAIAHGYKKYEYRRVTPYWTKRIVNRTYAKIVFQNGYGARFPTMEAEYLGYDIAHNAAGEPHYRLKLGAISNVANYTLVADAEGREAAACVDLNRCLDARRPRDCMRFCAQRGAWLPRPAPPAPEPQPQAPPTPVPMRPAEPGGAEPEMAPAAAGPVHET